jgi:hypothetical protein
MVRPINNIPIAESIAKLDELQGQYAEMKAKFETVDGVEAKFPHPYFGDLSAAEWLVLRGGHEERHIEQIDRIIANM